MQKNTYCPPLTQKGLSALYSDAGVISFLIPPSSFLEKEKTNHEEAKDHRAGGEGDSSRAHGIPHGTGDDQLHGKRTVLRVKIELLEQREPNDARIN